MDCMINRNRFLQSRKGRECLLGDHIQILQISFIWNFLQMQKLIWVLSQRKPRLVMILLFYHTKSSLVYLGKLKYTLIVSLLCPYLQKRKYFALKKK